MKLKMEDKKILVFYIDVRNLDSNDIGKYISELNKKLELSNPDYNSIFIPTYSDTKVECINPKYITDIELKKTHLEKIGKLNEELINSIKDLKNG